MAVACVLTPARCHSPTDCHQCRHFKRADLIWNCQWLCPRCMRPQERFAKPYYRAGRCDECDEFFAVLTAVPTRAKDDGNPRRY